MTVSSFIKVCKSLYNTNSVLEILFFYNLHVVSRSSLILAGLGIEKHLQKYKKYK